MRRNKRSLILVSLLIVAMMLTACGAKKNSASEDRDATQEYEESLDKGNAASVSDEEMTLTDTSYEDKGVSPEAEAGTGTNPGAVNSNQKLIRTFILDVEAEDYDKMVPAIQKKVTGLGGYIESSQLDGNSYYDDNRRYAQMVVRIPKANVDEFVNTVDKIGNVTSRSENAQDVTLQYVDTQSHQKSLKIEQERLLSLLEKAEKLADIITLEERLSQVRYEIESYASLLRTYDNQVDYSTVTLTITEVNRITPVNDETAFDKMRTGLSDSLYNIKTGGVNFAIWFVVNLPYLIIWAVIIIVAVVITMKVIKKNKKKSNLPMNGPVKKEEEKKEEE